MKPTVKELVIFGMLGALMYTSKLVMEFLPNIHLIGVFIIAMTIVYRQKALYPIYTFVLITGLVSGFAFWWIPYLYIWTVLWGLTMLIPTKLPRACAPVVYMLLCALHGILFGVLYAPAQAVMFGLSFEQMLVWISSGLVFDVTHCIGNFCAGILICPIINILKKYG